MKYFCRNKDGSNEFGMGESIEEALSDYMSENDSININHLEWFECKKIVVALSVKQTPTTKAKK